MNRDEAEELAKRIKRSWRGGPVFDEWCNYLAGFDDPARVSRALDELREVEPLSFRVFGEKYRALAGTTYLPPVEVAIEPRLTREQRLEILTAAGAPLRLVRGSRWSSKGDNT